MKTLGTNQELLGAIFKLHDGRARVYLRSVDDRLTHLLQIHRGDRLWESQFSGEDRRNTNFIGFNVDIWGNN